MTKNDMRRYSLDDINAMVEKGDYVPTRKGAKEIDLDEHFWENARVMMPLPGGKIHTGIRLDGDVLAWFKSQGKGWQTRMNAALRFYMMSMRDTHRSDRPDA